MKFFDGSNTEDSDNADNIEDETKRPGFAISVRTIFTLPIEVVESLLEAGGLQRSCPCSREDCEANAPEDFARLMLLSASIEALSMVSDDDAVAEARQQAVLELAEIMPEDSKTLVSVLLYAVGRGNSYQQGLKAALEQLNKED